MPAPKAVRDILEHVLDREVGIAPGRPVQPGPLHPGVTVVFVGDRLALRGLAALDLAAAAHLGAARVGEPVGVALTAVRDGVLPESLLAGIEQLAGELAGLFGSAASPARVHQIVEPGQLAPSDVAVLTRRVGSRLDLSLRIQGYGGGQLSLLPGG